ncbi:MAG: S24 family peptidase [Myxococcales bacterium]|nr:S24 family peptidase [Myxococcales bacterium]
MTNPTDDSQLSADEAALVGLYRRANDQQRRALLTLARAAAIANSPVVDALPAPVAHVPSRIPEDRALGTWNNEPTRALPIEDITPDEIPREEIARETIIDTDEEGLAAQAKRIAASRTRTVWLPFLGDVADNPRYRIEGVHTVAVDINLLAGRADKANVGIVRVSDGAMAPTVLPGQFLVVDYDQDAEHRGQLVLVCVDGVMSLRRYVEASTGLIHLTQDSPGQQSDVQMRRDQVEVIGVALGVLEGTLPG